MSPMKALKALVPRALRLPAGRLCRATVRYADRRSLLRELRAVAGRRKILYAITPHPGLANVGDHAQAIAIHDWLAAEFPHVPVVELDKVQVHNDLDVVMPHVTPEDLVFLHSGGNMGDRGMFSETARRRIIEAFPSNAIISLPQTIFFSDTERGRGELATSRRIYSAHPLLTIVARDHVSDALAREYFASCRHHVCPDFVLYLDDRVRPLVAGIPRSETAVLCLRNDNESILEPAEREQLAESVSLQSVALDTSVPHGIRRHMRWQVFSELLTHFASSRLVVTDRFHGVIFAVLTRTPCIVLPTVDHKLEAAYRWFESIHGVRFAGALDQVPTLAPELVNEKMTRVPNWSDLFFDGLGQKLVGEGST